MDIFSMDFLAALGSLVLLDIILGGDNAVVIAMAANKLSPEHRRRAVWIGTVGAILIRFVMTLAAAWLLTVPYLQALGGLVLLPIAVKLLLPVDKTLAVKSADNLRDAIKTIILADAVMGVDNVLAIAGASHGSLVLVALGFLISIPIIIGGSTFLGKCMERHVSVIYAGAALLGWTAGSMIGHDKLVGPMLVGFAGEGSVFFVQLFLAVGVILIGWWKRKK